MTIRIGYQSGRSPFNNVISYLDQHGESQPNKIALKWVDMATKAAWVADSKTTLIHKEISYGDLQKRIVACAAALKEKGLRAGDRVIVFLPMSVEMYVAMFAVQRLGAISVFLDSWARSHHLGASAKCVEPRAMISFSKAFELVNPIPEFSCLEIKVCLDSKPDDGMIPLASLIASDLTDCPMEPVQSEDTALITFTTGSSGTPKGANRTHRFLCAQHEALQETIAYTDTDVDLPAFPIFSLNNLASGVTTVLPAIDLAQPSDSDGELLAAQLIAQSCSCATLSPNMLRLVSAYCEKHGIQLERVRRMTTGGAPISKDDVKEFLNIAPESDVMVLYGSTEAEPMAHISGREMIALPTNEDPEIIERGVNVGEIYEKLDFKFIRIHRDPVDLAKTPWAELEVEMGKVGELLVSGDHVCRDYYNNPGAFAKAKIADGEKIWHRTGDLGFLDSDKRLWIVGRIHNVIERAGECFFPVQAEILLKRISGVKRGAFLGFPCSKLGNKNVLAVELDSGADVSKVRDEARRIFRKNEIVVDEFYQVAEIPMDPRHFSKVEYGILRDKILEDKSENLWK